MTADERVNAAVEVIRTALAGYVFRVRNEAELQDSVCKVLGDIGHGTFRREAQVDGGRCDIIFKIHHVTVVIELKLKASAASVERQAQRYALMPDVDAVVVVTTSRRLAALLVQSRAVSMDDETRADLERLLANRLRPFVGRLLTEDAKRTVQREIAVALGAFAADRVIPIPSLDVQFEPSGSISIRYDGRPTPTLGGKPFHVIPLRTS